MAFDFLWESVISSVFHLSVNCPSLLFYIPILPSSFSCLLRFFLAGTACLPLEEKSMEKCSRGLPGKEAGQEAPVQQTGVPFKGESYEDAQRLGSWQSPVT